ncbi:hypothetical protein [Acinetobacter nectaris]
MRKPQHDLFIAHPNLYQAHIGRDYSAVYVVLLEILQPLTAVHRWS